MRKDKKKRLEAAGWTVGSTADFLELTPAEREFIELKLSLSHDLKQRRLARGMTQAELAEEIGSSQARVARMEAAHGSVSIDLLVRSLCTMGATRRELAQRILDGCTWRIKSGGPVPSEVIAQRRKRPTAGRRRKSKP